MPAPSLLDALDGARRGADHLDRAARACQRPSEPLPRALGQLHGLGDRPDAADVRRLTDAYAPYRMWVCFLLRVAAGRNIIPGLVGREMAIRRATRG